MIPFEASSAQGHGHTIVAVDVGWSQQFPAGSCAWAMALHINMPLIGGESSQIAVGNPCRWQEKQKAPGGKRNILILEFMNFEWVGSRAVLTFF